MSTYLGNTLISGIGRHTVSNAHNLLDFKWSDHLLNSMEWLNSSTFSWQSGQVYLAVYNHLSADITGKSLQSETISGITIQYYLADDGHKICPASEESNVSSLFSATGVAWYYIIDTTNTRFKLPRSKFSFDVDRNPANTNTVYLYFYVGQYTQSAIEQTAGITSEELNAKVDKDSSWGFPSNTYIDLTLGASGSTYTAPADGYLALSKKSTASGQYLNLSTVIFDSQSIATAASQGIHAWIPLRKGSICKIEYSLAGATEYFRFIYAVGSEP